MDTPIFHIGDLVTVADGYARPQDRGVVYRITRRLKVNVEAVSIPDGRRLRAHPLTLVPATAEQAESARAAEATATATVTSVPMPQILWPGTVVTVTAPRWHQPPNDLFVILRSGTSSDTFTITRLGSTDGRYWRGVPRQWLTVIDAARITIADMPTT